MARILVVDDSAVMRKNLVSILTQGGHTVVGEAMSGGQAHLMYRTYLPDLVTMDITMPGINGIDAVKLIIKDYPDAKIIMVSALNQRNMVFEALEHGAKHYLIKPVTPDSVKTVVQKVLGIKPINLNTNESQGKSQAETAGNINEKIEPVIQQPFAIESINNMFQIKITKYLTEESFKSLQQAIQGLLFVKPLKVVIDFGNLEVLPHPLLEKIGEIVKAISGANGILKIVAQNKDFTQLIRDKKIEGLSDQITTELNNSPVNKEIVRASGTSSAETAGVVNELFPKGHKHYSLEPAGPIDNFIYLKKITCPVCNNSIEIQVVRFTKLAINKVDPDFRQHFVGFEPLWYSVQICPQCNYASLGEDFDKITEKVKSVISQKLSEQKVEVATKFPAERNINQVFTSYYLVLYWLKGITTHKLQEGKLWLRLAWLYEDVNDLELSKMASEKALTLYKDLYHNSRRETTVEQDQRLTMLLGELCMRNDLRAEAQQYFRDTIVHKGGNKVMNETARDRMRDIHV